MPYNSTNPRGRVNRRDFLKITALAGLALGSGGWLVHKLLASGELRKVAETHLLMGTIVNFVAIARDEALAQSAIRAALSEMTRLILIHDYRQPESPLARLNASGRLEQAPAELLSTLRYALELGAASGGAFDITVQPLVQALREERAGLDGLLGLVDYRLVGISGTEISLARTGMAITLDGIAKGSVVDAGVAVFNRLGFENVLVEAGGDLLAKSSATQGEKWQVGVAHPRSGSAGQQGGLIASFSVENKGVATSGDYLNAFNSDYTKYHIVDPHTGRCPQRLASATVIAASAAEADALSTTLMVLGPEAALDFVEKLDGVEALLVGKDLAVWRSSGFPAG
ncbi:MAG TPA: FAD:protein FMN transferase [Anaerolineales bacterium]|jgi:thiamine biosynthesis lipoprotein